MTTSYEYGRTFLHSVNLDDRFAYPLIRQLLNMQRAWSPDYFAGLDPGLKEAHNSMRDVDIDELRFKAFEYPGIPTPGAGTAIWMGSMLRAGNTLHLGALNPKPLPKKEVKYALMKSDIELEFEAARRRIAPKAVSRLNCLYVADDIMVIKSIANLDSKAPVLRVRIAKGSLVSRVDMSWFDDFAVAYRKCNEAQCNEFVNNYWMSNPHKSGNCKWEYLVDGMIEVVGGLDDLRDALDERDELT
jgi:hypothetical protein